MSVRCLLSCQPQSVSLGQPCGSPQGRSSGLPPVGWPVLQAGVCRVLGELAAEVVIRCGEEGSPSLDGPSPLPPKAPPTGETGETRYINSSSDFYAIYFGVWSDSAAAALVRSDSLEGITGAQRDSCEAVTLPHGQGAGVGSYCELTHGHLSWRS